MSLTEHDIIYKPRTGDEMKKATLDKVPIHLYSDLCKLAKMHGPSRVISHMLRRSNEHIILLQDPSNMHSGHWISLSCNPRRKQIYFFSTYGGKPDAEKVRWVSEDDLRESNQFLNLFNEGLHDLQQHGWEIHYNDYPYQKAGDNTATCGIFTVAFLRSGLNPDEFEAETKRIERMGEKPAVYYYRKYFR